MTWDNYFSGDQIMEWLGANGFSATMTTNRGRAPVGVPREFMCLEKTKVDTRSKVARFNKPICYGQGGTRK